MCVCDWKKERERERDVIVTERERYKLQTTGVSQPTCTSIHNEWMGHSASPWHARSLLVSSPFWLWADLSCCTHTPACVSVTGLFWLSKQVLKRMWDWQFVRFDVLKFEFISADNKRPLFVLISLCKSPARTAKHRLHFIVKHQPLPFPTLVVFLPRRLKFPLASLLTILFESFCRLIFARFGIFPWGFAVRQIAPHFDRSESRKCFAELSYNRDLIAW